MHLTVARLYHPAPRGWLYSLTGAEVKPLEKSWAYGHAIRFRRG
jgi:hypothetical protein